MDEVNYIFCPFREIDMITFWLCFVVTEKTKQKIKDSEISKVLD